ncbi:MAG: cation transporter [Proteobacteria bacterium]|nr:cation transporter [Pseudomonadota bacterium]
MTEWLIRRFIKTPEKVKDPAVRVSYGRLASLVGILCNVLLCAGKFLAGAISGSIAIMADAVNNLSDAASNIVSLLGFRLASKAPDEKHPYGYARYEYLAGFAVSAMIVAIGLSLGKDSVTKIMAPEETTFSYLAVAILVVSIVVKIWMSRFSKNIGTRIDSDALVATAADSRNDVLSTGAVLVSTILCHVTGFAMIDGIMGLLVALFIVYSGWGLVRETLSPLLGESPDPTLVSRIEEKVLGYEGVLGMHDLIVHDYGPGHQFASLHVEMPAEMDPLMSHDIIDCIEDDLFKSEHIHVSIHYDPIVTSDDKIGKLRQSILEIMKAINPELTMHDLRIVPGESHTNVLFDLVFPPEDKSDKHAVSAEVAARLREIEPKYVVKIKAEQSYT